MHRRPTSALYILCAALSSSCLEYDMPPGERPVIAMLQYDFSSSFDGNPARYRREGWSSPDRYGHLDAPAALTVWLFDAASAPGFELEAARSDLTLTRVSDGRRVGGTVLVGWYGIDGSAIDPDAVAISFVPAGPLEPGWHVLRMDIGPTLRGFRAGAVGVHADRRVGDVLYARFRMDSAPSWVGTFVGNVGPYPYDRTTFHGRLSEPDAGVDWAGTRLEVRYDGVVQDCDWPRFGDDGFLVTCSGVPFPSLMTLELDSPAVTDPAGERPTVHAIPYDERLDWGDLGILVSPDLGIEAADAASR